MAVLIAIVICCLTKTLYAQTRCTTPNNELAKCIPFKECKVFLDALKNGRPPASIIDFMRESSCKFDNDPLVCCGSFNHSIESTPPNADPTKHKNFHLLPKNCGIQDVDERVPGGDSEAQLEEFPWMVLLEYPDPAARHVGSPFLCGGALINSQYILTVAHCMSSNWGRPFSVRLGDHDLSSEIDCRKKFEGYQNYELCVNAYEDIPIDRMIWHSGYRPRKKINDIALIRLLRPVTINTSIKPICLPVNFKESPPGKRLFVAGWGYTGLNSSETRRTSNVKLKVQLPIVAIDKCKEMYPDTQQFSITKQQYICAGGEEGMDTCQGDSGQALMSPKVGSVPSQWYMEGIVSFGKGCGVKGYPGIFTRVSSHINWILDHITE